MKHFSYNQSLLVSLICFLYFFTGIGIVHAQSAPAPSSIGESVSIVKSPQFVDPYEEMTISITSRLINLNNNEIVWTKNGQVVASGLGVDEVTITVGDTGETTTVGMETRTGEGEFISRKIEVVPATIDLVWEAINSYTPPLYKGKALHSGWGDVRITAIPHVYQPDGSTYSQDELVYTWEYNGLVYGDKSGRGVSSFTVQSVPRDGNRVTVEVETPEGDQVAYQSISLPIDQPEVVMYRGSRLLGTLFSEAVTDSFTLTDDEVQLSAYPYFYLTDTAVKEDLVYDWEMNSESVTPAEEENLIRLRQQSGVDGRANVSLNINDESRIFPDASANATFEF